MKAEEKAKELVNRFVQYTPAEEKLEYPYAKQCALICVEEITKHRSSDLQNPDITSNEIESVNMVLNYWASVKSEIEKL